MNHTLSDWGTMADQKGCLWVADISGFTGYLNESELEHAEGTLTDLLQVLIDKPGSPLIVSKLEGDAVFAYAIDDEMAGGQTFLELVEDTYVEFRRTIELMVLNNTCQCNACANVSSLDLKFVIHHGEFRMQEVGGFSELVGSDVNLVHRLMKNSVAEATGIRAYCLYTDQARRALGLEEIADLTPHKEEVADFGDLDTWVQDLGAMYEERRHGAKVELGDEEVMLTITTHLPMKPSEVWNYLAAPEFRALLTGSDKQVITDRAGGRTGLGSVYQCYHGKDVVPQVVVEWDPFRRVVTEETWTGPWKAKSIAVIELAEDDAGTTMTRTFGRIDASRSVTALGKVLMPSMMRKVLTKNTQRFVDAAVADREARKHVDPRIEITQASIIDAARSSLRQPAG